MVNTVIMIVGSKALWGCFIPQTRFGRKKKYCKYINIFSLYNMYLPHSITVMFCKTTSFKTTHILLLLKIRSLNMKSVFSQVHHQCKLHSEYSSLVNVATTKNVS